MTMMPIDRTSQKAFAGASDPRRLNPVTPAKISSAKEPIKAAHATAGLAPGATSRPERFSTAKPDAAPASRFNIRDAAIPVRCAGLLADAVLLALFAPFYGGWIAYRTIQRWRGKAV